MGQSPTPPDFISQQIQRLRSPDAKTRAEGAWNLWIFSNDPRAIEPLMVNLKGPDPEAARMASLALGKIGPPAVPSLLEVLQDPDAYTRVRGLEAIAKIQDARVIPAVRAALQDPNQAVRDKAMESLAQSGDPGALREMVSLLAHAPQKEWVHDSAALRYAGSAAIGPLLELLRSGQAEDRLRASSALRDLEWSDPRVDRDNPSLLDTWLALTRDPDARIRSNAIQQLTRKNDPRIVPALWELRSDPEASVRSSAMAALERFNDPRVIAIVAARLDDPDRGVRMHAALVLARDGDPRGLQPVLEEMKGMSSEVRSSAADALGSGKYPEAVPALIEAMNDSSLEVRTFAARSLGDIGDTRAAAPLAKALTRDLGDPTLSPGGVSSEKVMREQQGDQYGGTAETLRENEITALGKLRDPVAIPALVAALDDEIYASTASEALGDIGDPRAAGALLAALRRNEGAQFYAAGALGKLGPGALGPITAALQDPSAKVRAGAAFALGEIGDRRSHKPVLALLHDPDPEVRKTSIYALGRMKDRGAIKPLLQCLSDPTGISLAAATALGEMGAPAVKPLLAALKSPDGMVRKNAAYALSLTNDPVAQAALFRILDEPDAEAITGAYIFFIEEGKPGSEEALIDALHRAGDEPMARGLVNCGNERLATATWGWIPGTDLQMRPFYPGLRWGQKPESVDSRTPGKQPPRLAPGPG